jgi:hypothetical protein
MAGPRGDWVLALLDEEPHAVRVLEVRIDRGGMPVAQRGQQAELGRPNPRLRNVMPRAKCMKCCNPKTVSPLA